MRFLVTGAHGFLGSRIAALLEERGHDVVRLARSPRSDDDVVLLDAGDPAARRLIGGCDAVLHFAGVPDPAGSRADPARAVRENVGTTLNLLEGCAETGVGLLYPSTVRAALDAPPDEYALSKRLGEELCRLHPAPATVLRLTSVFGPGQVAWEGATGAIASFAARALERRPIVIHGDPARTRDFVYVDDLVPPLEQLVEERRWNETITLGSGVATPLATAAELVREAAGTGVEIEHSPAPLPRGENESYAAGPAPMWLRFAVRPLPQAVRLYVDSLRSHPAAQGRART
jgi:UDP-glucose 4-epimerase